ncbi:hypothetical protein D9M68_582570 [compost metagenome]
MRVVEVGHTDIHVRGTGAGLQRLDASHGDGRRCRARRCKAEFRGPPLAHRQVEHEDLGIVQVVVELGIRLLNGQRRVRAVSQQRGNDLGEVGTLDRQALRSKGLGSRVGG